LDAVRDVFFAGLRTDAGAARRGDGIPAALMSSFTASDSASISPGPIHVALRMDAELRQGARNAVLEYLLQLVPGPANAPAHLAHLCLGGAACGRRRILRRAACLGLQDLALLDQCFEHLLAFDLRA
jgi:hypothetical protein